VKQRVLYGLAAAAVLAAGVAAVVGTSVEAAPPSTFVLLDGSSKTTAEQPFHPAGALGLSQSVKVAATGQRPDGSKIQSQAAYFAQGHHVFQAVIYGSVITPEAADPFFAGLRFP
jgi:hypothetical protein